MADINKVYLRGRISSDIEQNHSKNGKIWCRFLLCVNEFNPQAETGERNIASFLNLICFNKNLVNYLVKNGRKGNRIDVEGKITVTKKEVNGRSFYYTNILITDAAFLKSKADEEEEPNPEKANITDNTPF